MRAWHSGAWRRAWRKAGMMCRRRWCDGALRRGSGISRPSTNRWPMRGGAMTTRARSPYCWKPMKADTDWIKKADVALRRAAKRALEVGQATGTPVYALEGGRIVNLLAPAKAARKAPRKRRA